VLVNDAKAAQRLNTGKSRGLVFLIVIAKNRQVC
jgi:hypothetical protein